MVLARFQDLGHHSLFLFTSFRPLARRRWLLRWAGTKDLCAFGSLHALRLFVRFFDWEDRTSPQSFVSCQHDCAFLNLIPRIRPTTSSQYLHNLAMVAPHTPPFIRMPLHAKFPHSWFAEAGPLPSASGSNVANETQGITNRRPSATSVESDADVTQDLQRRNSFDFVVDMAKQQESVPQTRAAEAGQQVRYPPKVAITSSAIRPHRPDNRYRERARFSEAGQSAGAENIKLRTMSKPAEAHDVDTNKPALPPLARLPRS